MPAAEATWGRLAPVAILALVSVLGAVVVSVLPTAGMQVAVVVGAAAIVGWLMASQAGRLLNAAGVNVLAVYLLDPGSILLPILGSPLPMVALVALAPLPFVATALWLRPLSRARLLRLAPVLGLLAVAVLSLAWSPDAEYGAAKLALWVVTGVIPAAAMLVLASPDRPVAWRVVAGAAFVYAIVLLVIGNTTLYPGRLVFFDANPIWIARAVFLGVLVVLFGPVPPVVRLILLPPMLVAGYLTDSLGPTLGLVIGASVGVAEAIRVSSLSRHRVRLLWALLVIATLAALAVVTAVVTSTAPGVLAPIVQDPNVTSRAEYLEIAARLFAGAPLLGAGLGAFAAAGAADVYPHNMLAEVASELGLLGLGLLGGWIVMAARGALGSPLLVALVTGTTVFTLFSGNLAGNAEFWICTGIAVAMLEVRRRPPVASAGTAT